MSEQRMEPTKVTLDLTGGSDPIEGQLTRGAEPAEPFAGWLELMALLERVRAPHECTERADG